MILLKKCQTFRYDLYRSDVKETFVSLSVLQFFYKYYVCNDPVLRPDYFGYAEDINNAIRLCSLGGITTNYELVDLIEQYAYTDACDKIIAELVRAWGEYSFTDVIASCLKVKITWR